MHPVSDNQKWRENHRTIWEKYGKNMGKPLEMVAFDGKIMGKSYRNEF